MKRPTFRSRPLLVVLTILASLTLFATACGSGSSSGDTNADTSDTSTENSDAASDTSTDNSDAASDTTDTGADTTDDAAADAGADTTDDAAADADAGGDSAAAGNLPDLGGRTVSVGIDNAYLPFSYVPVGSDQAEGWDYDAWNEICRLLNCKADFVVAGWPAVIEQVGNGELDTAADGISITEERKQVIAYSDSYMTVQQKLVVAVDDDRYDDTAASVIDDPEALIGTQVGTTNYELGKKLVGEDRIKAFDQFGLAIQALIIGDVDAVIIDDMAGLGYVGENADKIRTIDDGLQSDPLGFIFPKDSDLIDPVNQALAEMKASGFMDQIGEKFFGSGFTVTYDDIEEVEAE